LAVHVERGGGVETARRALYAAGSERAGQPAVDETGLVARVDVLRGEIQGGLVGRRPVPAGPQGEFHAVADLVPGADVEPEFAALIAIVDRKVRGQVWGDGAVDIGPRDDGVVAFISKRAFETRVGRWGAGDDLDRAAAGVAPEQRALRAAED